METFGVDECAAFLNVNRTTVLDLAGSGELPGAQIGRAWVFLKEDVVDYLKKKIREQSAARRAKAEVDAFVSRKEERAEPAILPTIMTSRSGRQRKLPPTLPDLPQTFSQI